MIHGTATQCNPVPLAPLKPLLWQRKRNNPKDEERSKGQRKTIKNLTGLKVVLVRSGADENSKPQSCIAI